MARHKHGKAHEYNGRRKRNDGMGGGFAKLAVGVGKVLLAGLVASGAMLLVSMQSLDLSTMSQSGILILGGIVVAAAGMAWGAPLLAPLIGAGMATVGINYGVLSWGTRRAGNTLAARVNNLASQPAAPALPAASQPAASATAPGGWVASTPAWTNAALPRSAVMSDRTNITSSPYAAAYG